MSLSFICNDKKKIIPGLCLMEKNLNLKEYIPCNEALGDPIAFFARLKATDGRSLLPWEHALMQEIEWEP